MKNTSILIVLCIAVAGCSSGSKSTTYTPKETKEIPVATITPGNDADVFPVAVGNRWRYKTERVVAVGNTQTPQADDFFLEVKNIEEIPDGKRVTVEQVKNDVSTERQVWEVRKDGIYELTIGMDKPQPFTPALLQIPFPVENGKEFSWEGTGYTQFGKIGNIKMTGTIIGPEEVDTDSGRVSAIRVETKKEFSVGTDVGNDETTVWYAPKMGIVRMQQTVKSNKGVATVFRMRLSQVTLK